ncbi:hypothetical protein [Novosphingobium sp. JCM 18896]|uniref:hypothetical protein n=1 Tax=Novosphingobium sp. JCM 18896 TaxID=2989731 RepID=UPI002221B994|nr:hypothetical protein [Novosphingobium sp. JCM 18896]MCW1432159.1 hypothetical protein [Novosphingobium sp. JCM 18896]
MSFQFHHQQHVVAGHAHGTDLLQTVDQMQPLTLAREFLRYALFNKGLMTIVPVEAMAAHCNVGNFEPE